MLNKNMKLRYASHLRISELGKYCDVAWTYSFTKEQQAVTVRTLYTESR